MTMLTHDWSKIRSQGKNMKMSDNNNKFIYILCIINLTYVIPSTVYNSKIDKIKSKDL